MNERPFRHITRRGTAFECPRCDFVGAIVVSPSNGEALTPDELAAEVAEMIGYHACAIWPKLNGFRGYATLRFIVTGA